jgi:hypothetical protein
MKREELAEWIRKVAKSYLDEVEGHGLESDGFITGTDVTFEGFKGALEDLAGSVENGLDVQGVSD